MKPPFEKIQTDFHRLRAGDWFMPMTIKDVNQHELIPQAIAKGIAGLIFEVGQELPAKLPIPTIPVPDLRQDLFARARERRDSLNTDIAVITGSAGKTSVKELIGAIFREANPASTFLSPENQNTKIALATQILRLPTTCQTAVFEMGARRQGDFQIPLSYLQPSVVAILNIGSAHLGEFGSLENLQNEKLSVLDSTTAKTAVIHRDDPRIVEKAKSCGKRLISFGLHADSDVRVVAEDHTSVTLEISNEQKNFAFPSNASAKGINLAAAVAVAIAFRIPLSTIEKAVAGFHGTSRRYQVFQWGNVTAIDDAFNASPESMQAGLQQVATDYAGKNVLLVLGSMLELGNETKTFHRKLGTQIAALEARFEKLGVVTVGTEAQDTAAELQGLFSQSQTIRSFPNSEAARDLVREWRGFYDVIFFKGSKSLQLQKIFENP